MKKASILVTGVGGDIGQGCGRILSNCEFVAQIVGCDIHDEHCGNKLFSSCEVIPRATDNNYFNALNRLVDKYSLDAIIPTSEGELRLINYTYNKSQNPIISVPLVMANAEAMRVGFDKLETNRFLKQQNIDVPWTVAVDESDPLSFPCILKSRYGSGSNSVQLLYDSSSLSCYKEIFKQYVFQEYLPNDNQEYTCGIYRSNKGVVRSITLRRRISSGVTSFAETIFSPEVSQLCEDVANALQLRGSINIQLRVTPNGAYIFEINPRFSSTVVFRHKLGFKDLVWSIQEQVLNTEASHYNPPNQNIRMYRVFDEWIENGQEETRD